MTRKAIIIGAGPAGLTTAYEMLTRSDIEPVILEENDFVGGIRGTGELEKLVDSGKFAVAFSMYPTTVAQLMDIADAGEIMPPKSTWFEPKLRSGLFVYTF